MKTYTSDQSVVIDRAVIFPAYTTLCSLFKETPRPVVKEEVKVVEKPPAVDGK